MAFSPVDSAFEGFRVARRAPLAILIWGALAIMYVGVLLWIMGPYYAELLPRLFAGQMGDAGTLSLLERQPALAPLLTPIGIAYAAVLYTAAIRAVIQPQDKAFGFLRVGMEEVYVWVTNLVVTLVLMIPIFIVYMILVGIAVGIGIALGEANMLATAIAVGVLALVFVCAVIWVLVRFSLAMPISFAERRFAIFDSWKMTKGHFWSLFGMYLLAGVMSVVVTLLVSIVALPLLYFALGGFDNLQSLASTPLTQMLPFAAVSLVVYGLFSGLQMAIMQTPAASAYLGIKGTDVADTFGDAPGVPPTTPPAA